MSSFRIKPRFKHYTNIKFEEMEKMILENLNSCDYDFQYKYVKGYMVIQIPKKDRNIWSPELNLAIEEEDGRTVVIGRYGPDSKTFITILVMYIVIGLLTFFIGIYGSAQYTVNKSAPILWLIPALLVVGLGVYITAQLGQKLGASQMYRLHFFYEKMIGHKIDIR
ncbi:MAG: hypothetical protein R2771_06795 [Saprospiraceae bacterium]